MTDWIHSYGLGADPFANVALKPTQNPDDANRLARVDGCRGIDESVARLTAKDSAFALIIGGSGTGRSSVANFLGYAWHSSVARHREKLLLVDDLNLKSKGYDSKAVVKDAFGWLRYAILGAGHKISPTLQELFDNVQNGAFDPESPQYAWLSKTVEDELAEKFKVAFLIEGLRDGKTLAGLVEAFSRMSALLVFVADDVEPAAGEVRQAFNSLVDRHVGDQLGLGPLRGADVAELVGQRWAAAQSNSDVPFDMAAIERIFDANPRSLARALNILGDMLNIRRINVASDAVWPDNPELGLSSALVENMFHAIEANRGVGI